MWLCWCARHIEPADKRIARRGRTRGRGVAIAQEMSIVRDQVVENQRSVERTTARRRHPIFLFGLRNFLYQRCIRKIFLIHP